jgi:hypothetical protein
MFLAFITLITGLALSAIAIYYSVQGLASIFSAAVIPIIIMGSILEIAKLVNAWWLKANWSRAPFLLKSYLLTATIVLMLITSMGIFGFLSKAHSDQSLVGGDVISRISLIDEKIKIERDNIENARAVIKQLDDAVNGINANGSDREIKLRDGRTYTRSAAEQALQVRRSQAKDRANLTKQIEQAQNNIVKLQEESAPIRAEMRKVEAEVGPIKYIAAFVYGDNPDTNVLEKAVTWVIIIIVFVFDPLAVLLLLASQMSFGWAKEQQEKEKDWGKDYFQNIEDELNEAFEKPAYEKDDGLPTEDQIKQIQDEVHETYENTTTKKETGSLFNEPEVLLEPSINNGEIVSSETTNTDAIIAEETKATVVKKKAKKQKVAAVSEAKEQSLEDTYFQEPKNLNSQVDSLIDSGDSASLEAVYKKIVKELGKQNRSKTNHWGPLKTKK